MSESCCVAGLLENHRGRNSRSREADCSSGGGLWFHARGHHRLQAKEPPQWQDQDQPHFTQEETERSGSPVPGALCTHSQRQERPRKRRSASQRGESDGVWEDRARQGCEQAWAQSWEGPDPQASGVWDPESLAASAMKE